MLYALIAYVALGLGYGCYTTHPITKAPHTKLGFLGLSVLFWPLLASIHSPVQHLAPQTKETTQPGPYHDRIEQLFEQLQTLPIRPTEQIVHTLLHDHQMLPDIKAQLQQLDQQLLELQELTTTPTFQEEALQARIDAIPEGTPPRTRKSLQIQLNNAKTLQALYTQKTHTLQELLGLLEQLHSELTLLRFTQSDTTHLHTDIEHIFELLDTLQELPGTSSKKNSEPLR